jgi:Flp pilus assembly protein TadB
MGGHFEGDGIGFHHCVNSHRLFGAGAQVERPTGKQEKQMKHYLVLALILCAAAAFYFAGLVSGVIAVFCIGAVLEAVFWIRLMQRRRNAHLAG